MKHAWFRPWYIWFPFPAFFCPFAYYGFPQLFAFLFHRRFDWNNWVLFCLHSIGLFFLPVMVPLALLLPPNAIGGSDTLRSYLPLLCLNLSGVFLTRHISRWAHEPL